MVYKSKDYKSMVEIIMTCKYHGRFLHEIKDNSPIEFNLWADGFYETLYYLYNEGIIDKNK